MKACEDIFRYRMWSGSELLEIHSHLPQLLHSASFLLFWLMWLFCLVNYILTSLSGKNDSPFLLWNFTGRHIVNAHSVAIPLFVRNLSSIDPPAYSACCEFLGYMPAILPVHLSSRFRLLHNSFKISLKRVLIFLMIFFSSAKLEKG